MTGSLTCCNLCRFFHHIVETPDGLCKRHSPLVTGGMMSSVETIWPSVRAENWCGDFEDADT